MNLKEPDSIAGNVVALTSTFRESTTSQVYRGDAEQTTMRVNRAHSAEGPTSSQRCQRIRHWETVSISWSR